MYILQLSNIYLYNECINVIFFKPIDINVWLMYLSVNEKPNIRQLCFVHFPFFREKQAKIFRWKLLQYITPAEINKNMEYCNIVNVSLWWRWRLSTLLYILFLYNRILGEHTVNFEKDLFKHFFSDWIILFFGYKISDKRLF